MAANHSDSLGQAPLQIGGSSSRSSSPVDSLELDMLDVPNRAPVLRRQDGFYHLRQGSMTSTSRDDDAPRYLSNV
jgi:hypothetical protein